MIPKDYELSRLEKAEEALEKVDNELRDAIYVRNTLGFALALALLALMILLVIR